MSYICAAVKTMVFVGFG